MYPDGRKCQPTLAGVLNRIEQFSLPSPSSSADFPANPTPSPASDLAGTTSDISGLKPRGLFESFDPVGSALRTCLESSIQRLMRCWATWTERATKSGRSYWALTTWGRRTEGSGSSSLGGFHSPCAGDAKDVPYRRDHGTKGRERPALLLQAQNWPTARAEDSESSWARHSRGTVDTLTSAVRTWPTPQSYSAPEGMGKPTWTPLDTATRGNWPSPQAHDDKNFGEATSGHSPQLRHARGLLDPESPNTTGSRPACSVVLNPAWVSCLMGFPEDWCDIGDVPLPRSETRSSHRTQK